MMEPKEITKVITCWTCLFENHIHKTKESAWYCINKNKRKISKINENKEKKKSQFDRQIRAVELRRAGKTFREIGEELGISQGRARDVFRVGMLKLLHPERSNHVLHSFAKEIYESKREACRLENKK